jgi:hypothetical protein
MRALLHWPCSLSSLGTVLGLLAGVLLAPAPARAGCGEHVVVIASPENAVLHSIPVPPMAPAREHAPCSGPHCKRLPLVPTPAPAIPVGLGGQQWAYLLEPLLFPAIHSTPCPQEGPRQHLFFVTPSVYHPPR